MSMTGSLSGQPDESWLAVTMPCMGSVETYEANEEAA